jgi:hypothetical protein
MAHKRTGKSAGGSKGWRDDYRDVAMPKGFPSRASSGTAKADRPKGLGKASKTSFNGLIAGSSYNWEKKR